MNWLTNFVRPKLKALISRKETPENLWLKCPKCEQMLFMRDWEANQEVCTHCGHHMRIRPLKRLPRLFDEGKYELHPLPKVPSDPLKPWMKTSGVPPVGPARRVMSRRPAVDPASS